MAVYTPHPLQIQLELFLVLNLQRLGLLDQFRGDGHALAEGSTRSSPQQATGHVGRRSLAQWGATEILHESPLVDKFGAWNYRKAEIFISQGGLRCIRKVFKVPH